MAHALHRIGVGAAQERKIARVIINGARGVVQMADSEYAWEIQSVEDTHHGEERCDEKCDVEKKSSGRMAVSHPPKADGLRRPVFTGR
jgi:hypothetical protein